MIKKIVKKILGAGEKETVSDAIQRKKYYLLKKMNHKKFYVDDLKECLIKMGLEEGDTVIVQSAWRSFIGFESTPQEVIECIKNIVGKNGTILMPAFTNNRNVFHYYDKSEAGYLTEIFRKNENVIRSLNSIFSMCAYGKKSYELTEEHINSKYCFDSNSPYYKAIQNNSKILLLGLGKRPHKVTIFHCASYELRNKVKCYNDVYTAKRKVDIYDESGKMIRKEIIDRQPKFQNNKKKFMKLFKKIVPNNNYSKINFLDIYLFDAKPFYERACNYIVKYNYNIYKKI